MTHGVTVALRFLVSSVKVRILVGQQEALYLEGFFLVLEIFCF